MLILVALGLPAWAASTLVGKLLAGAEAIAVRYFVDRSEAPNLV